MSLSITFRRATRTELIEAAARYETQQKNLGVEFITEIDRCIALAAEQPMIFVTVYKDIRRITAHRFPFSVYFRVERHRIVVLSVFHGSRDPAIWQRRV